MTSNAQPQINPDGTSVKPTRVILAPDLRVGMWMRRFDDGPDSDRPRTGGEFHLVATLRNSIGRILIVRGPGDTRIPGAEYGLARYTRVEVGRR